MSFTHYFKISSYCLITSGFVAIAVTGSVDLFSLALFGSALLGSWFIDTEKLQRRTPPWLLNLVALAYFPFYLLDYRFISGSFVVSTIHLIFLTATVKILTRSSDRDYVYLYLISFAELLAASILTVDLTFLISLLVFLISGVTTLMLFEMRRSNARALKHATILPVVVARDLRGTGLELFSSFPARSLSLMSVAITAMILLTSVPLFLVLPRVVVAGYKRAPGKSQFISGFSEKVRLGELGAIKLSDALVMRVRLGDSPADVHRNLKWRGVALEHYDGSSWTRSRHGRTRVPEKEGHFKLQEYIQGPETLRQTFFVEALYTDVVFAGHRALAVSSEIRNLLRDPTDSLFTVRNPSNKTQYSVVSEIMRPDPALIPENPDPPPDDIRTATLQLPPLDPRIGLLAREITRLEKHPFHKAAAVEKYLLDYYQYSLDMTETAGTSDPLSTFLFEVRKGHCEYFASAMTIMLRTIDIPARLVNGFRMGEYNAIGRDWIVRQYDAHSWVEAYFAPYGWIEFDPTPPDPERVRPRFVSVLANLADAVGLWWSDEIINYDFQKQVSLAVSIRQALTDAQQKLAAIVSRARDLGRDAAGKIGVALSPSRLAVAGVLAATLIILLHRSTGWSQGLKRFLGRLVFAADSNRFVKSFYTEALDLLRLRGFRRRRTETPLEFAESLGTHPARPDFTTLTLIYNKMRFGGPASDEDLGRAKRVLKDLRATLHRTPVP
jgi:transglutaminase-like putative cysteine protease